MEDDGGIITVEPAWGAMDWAEEAEPPSPDTVAVPSYRELVESVFSRLQSRLLAEGRQSLTDAEIRRVTLCFDTREQFYIMHDLADGPLHNLRRRMHRRMNEVVFQGELRRFNSHGSEDNISSDTEEDLANSYHSRAADWPRVHPPASSSGESEPEVEVQMFEFVERSPV